MKKLREAEFERYLNGLFDQYDPEYRKFMGNVFASIRGILTPKSIQVNNKPRVTCDKREKVAK